MDAATLGKYLNQPIQAPPAGVVPNYVNPDSTAYQVYITAGVCIVLMIMFAVLRLISRTKLRKTFNAIDEGVFILGLVFCFAFAAMTTACVSGGAFGRHAWNVLLGAFTKSQLVLALLVETTGPAAICLVKVSVLLLYQHLFGVLRWMRISISTGLTLIVLYHLSLTIAFAVMCSPAHGRGQLDYLAAFISPQCSRTRVLVVFQGVGNIVTDLFLLVLPLPAVWALQIRTRRKIAICSMFMVGLSACASSIIGLYYRVRYYSAQEDNVRLVVPLWATSIAENAAGVIICCMPSAAAVLKAAEGPVYGWLSSVGESTRRLASPFRSRTRISSDDSTQQRSFSMSETSQQAIFDYSDSRSRHTARVDSGRPTSQTRLTRGRIARQTEFMVTQEDE